ncbi:hypothetical protein [Infirmifilum sp. NZ]|uniref:hypothetical protein n=1 Tax=Infirmifilum sp. NZ TaxID=2926850 RepID=UPI0027A9629F|nr:hypothetical protein [Infirmifilum sp. NZ]UNQ74103.1 hypothetical protein MOV14_03565 [Infirmifilum sp. NZ]
MQPETRVTRAFSVKLIIIGFVLLAVGAILAASIGYQLSPREKILITLSLPLDHEETYPLPTGLSQKALFNLTYTGDRFVNLTLIFYDEGHQETGKLLIQDAARTASGTVYLNSSPVLVSVKSGCKACTSTVKITLYFARYNQQALDAQVAVSSLLAVAGSVILMTGGYAYVLAERKERFSSAQAFREELEQPR